MGSVALNAKPSRWENDVPQPTETLPDRIVSTAYLFRQSKVLFVAAELDVFGILAVGPLDLETLKARSGVHPRVPATSSMRWWPWGCSTGTARAATPTRPKAIATSFAVSPPILAGCCDISTSVITRIGTGSAAP